MKKILAFLALALLVLSCSLFEVEEEEKNQVVPSLPTAIDSSIPNIINSSCTITNDGVIGESIFATFTASLTSGVAFSGEDEQKRVLTGKLTSGKIYIERNDTGQIFSANLSVQNSFSTDEGDYTVGFVKDKGIVSISTAEGTIAGRLVAATGLSCQVSYTRDADGNIITSKPTTDPSPDPKKLLVKTPTVSLTEKGTALADGSLIQTTQVYVEVSELKEGSIVALYTDPQANTRAPGIGSDKIVKKGEQSLSFQVSGLARNTSYRFYAQVTSDSASAVSQGSALISIDKNALDPPSPPTLPGTDSFVAHSPLVSLKENGTALADGSLIQTTQVYVEVSELKEGYIVALYTDPQARTRAPGIGSDKIVKKGEQSLSFQVSGLARSASYRFYAQVTADSASAVSQGSALISIDKNALDPPQPPTLPGTDSFVAHSPLVRLKENGAALADGSLIQTTQVYVEVSELKEGYIVALYTDPQARTRAPGIGSDKIVKEGEQSLSFQVSSLVRSASYRFYAQVTSDSASAVSQGSALISIDKNALDPPQPPTPPGTDSFVAHSPLVSLKKNGTALADGSLIQTTQVYVEVSELKEGYIVALYTDPQARTRAPGIGSDKIVKEGEQSLSFQVSSLVRSASYRFYAQITTDSGSAISQGSALISIDKNALDPPPIVSLAENGDALADGSIIHITRVYVQVNNLKEGYKVGLYSDPQTTKRVTKTDQDRTVAAGETSLSFEVNNLQPAEKYRFYAQVTTEEGSAVSQGSALIEVSKDAKAPIPDKLRKFAASTPLVSLEKDGKKLAYDSSIDITRVYVKVSELEAGYKVGLYTDSQATERAPGIDEDHLVEKGKEYVSFEVNNLQPAESYRFYAKATIAEGSAVNQGSARINVSRGAQPPIPDELKEFAASAPIVSLAENGDALTDGSIIHITRVYVQVNKLKEGYKVGLYSDPQATKRVTKTDQDRPVAAGETSLSFEVNNLQPTQKYRFYAQVTIEEGSAVSQGSALIEVSKDAKAPIPDKLRKFAASTPLVSLEKDGKKLAYDSSIDITRVYVKVSELEAGYKVGLYTDSQATERAPGIDEDHLVEKGKEYVSFEVNNLQPAESYRFYAKATITEGSAVNQGSARINVSKDAQPPKDDPFNPIFNPYDPNNSNLQFSLDVSSTKSLLKSGESSQLKIRASEPVSYTLNTIKIKGGTVLNVSGSGTEFTAPFRAPTSGSGFLTIEVPKAAFTSSNEKKSVGTSLGVVFDAEKPTVKLYSSVAKLQKLKRQQTVSLYIEAQEIIKDLTADDIILNFGEVKELTPKGESILYRAEIQLPETVTAAQEKAGLKISIPANSFTDQAGNSNSKETESIAYSDSFLPALLSWPYEGLVLDENVMDGATLEEAKAENYYKVALNERKISIPQNLNYKNVRTNVSNILANFSDYQETETKRVNSFLLKGEDNSLYNYATLGKDQDLDESGWMLYVLQSQVFSLRFSALYWSLGNVDQDYLLKFIKGLTGTDYETASVDENGKKHKTINLDETVFYDFNAENSLEILRGVQLKFAEDIKRFFSQSSGVKINQSIIKSAWANAIINSTSVNKEDSEKFFARYIPPRLTEKKLIDLINKKDGTFIVSWGAGDSRAGGEAPIHLSRYNLSVYPTSPSSVAHYYWTDKWKKTGEKKLFQYDNTRKKYEKVRKITTSIPTYIINDPQIPESMNIGYIGGEGYTLQKRSNGRWYLKGWSELNVKISQKLIDAYKERAADYNTNYLWVKGTLRNRFIAISPGVFRRGGTFLDVQTMLFIRKDSQLSNRFKGQRKKGVLGKGNIWGWEWTGGKKINSEPYKEIED